jgi:hypothetical protein
MLAGGGSDGAKFRGLGFYKQGAPMEPVKVMIKQAP